MLTEARAQRTRHSFHVMPRSKLPSMDRLEKYSLLMLKEKQVVEKSEKAARLAAKCFTSLNEYDTPPRTKQTRSSLYGTLPRTRRNTSEMPSARSIFAKRPSLESTKSLPLTDDSFRRISLGSYATNRTPAPTVRWKDRQHSTEVTSRFDEARQRHDDRRQCIKSLEEDCANAKRIIERIKALSMPSLRSRTSSLLAASKSPRRLSSESEHEGLSIDHLVPCEVDIIDC